MNILLHICCAPCSLFTIDKLRQDGHKIEGFFYNPNIYPLAEYKLRRQAVSEMAKRMDVKVAYDPLPEGERGGVRGLISNETPSSSSSSLRREDDRKTNKKNPRCANCWRMRLCEASNVAKASGFDAFSTTLLISPYQDHGQIRLIGEDLVKEKEIDFYYDDFRVGFRKSQQMAKDAGYYRQKYCGCAVSSGGPPCPPKGKGQEMKNKIILSAIIFIALLAGQSQSVFSSDNTAYQPPIVRVAVFKDAVQLDLSVKSEFKFIALDTSEVLYLGRDLVHFPVKPTESGIKIGDTEFSGRGIRIAPAVDSTIFIKDRSFRGEICIIKQPNKTLLAVNHINVEDYLRGVLFHEVSHIWPNAVLEAQAIAARSFALYQAGVNKGRDYDLESSVYSQVYGGSKSEKYRANRAVDKTIGRVLTYKGSVFPAYYHATCAGHTEDASILWKTDIAPLRGVLCNFCRQSTHYYWNKKIPVTDLEKVLSIEGIQNIKPKKWDNSGRVVLLEINTKNNVKKEISGKDFRQQVGADIIKSTIFKIKIKPSFNGTLIANIDGAGWGHGVGMCQWGAFGMARRGWRAERILEYYYPGAKIEIYRGQ